MFQGHCMSVEFAWLLANPPVPGAGDLQVYMVRTVHPLFLKKLRDNPCNSQFAHLGTVIVVSMYTPDLPYIGLVYTVMNHPTGLAQNMSPHAQGHGQRYAVLATRLPGFYFYTYVGYAQDQLRMDAAVVHLADPNRLGQQLYTPHAYENTNHQQHFTTPS